MSTAIQRNVAPARVRSFHMRVTALGFVLIAMAGIVAASASLANGDTGENFVFSLVIVIVGLFVALVVWGARTWAVILAGVLSLALLGLVGPFSLFSLSHPEYAAEFVPVLLLLAGSALGLVGSIVSLVQSRRRTPNARASTPERLGLGALLGAVTLAVLLSLVLTVTSRTTVAAEAKAGAASMQFKNYRFAPNSLQAKSGDTVRIVIKNDDSAMHTFTLPAAGVDVAIPPGSERMVAFKAPAPGTYQYYCTPHSAESGGMHEGMVGTLHVQ